MNTLYSIITLDTDVSGYYAKKREGVLLSDKAVQLRDILTKDVSPTDMPKFACIVCSEILVSEYAELLRSTDPVNTYTEVSKDPSVPPVDCTAAGLFKPVAWYMRAAKYLDDDLKEHLVCPSLMNIVAAISIQLLREV